MRDQPVTVELDFVEPCVVPWHLLHKRRKFGIDGSWLGAGPSTRDFRRCNTFTNWPVLRLGVSAPVCRLRAVSSSGLCPRCDVRVHPDRHKSSPQALLGPMLALPASRIPSPGRLLSDGKRWRIPPEWARVLDLLSGGDLPMLPEERTCSRSRPICRTLLAIAQPQLRATI